MKKIVKEIEMLKHKDSSLPTDYLVGVDTRVEELTKLLHVESLNGVRVIGICGMCGIGKTTLGSALFEKLKPEFDFYGFINVRIIYQNFGKQGVQKELLSKTLREKNLDISNDCEGKRLVSTRLRNVKALTVFDNVDQVKELEMFEETPLRECFGQGSIIIIISRDEQIFNIHKVNAVYRVQALN